MKLNAVLHIAPVGIAGRCMDAKAVLRQRKFRYLDDGGPGHSRILTHIHCIPKYLHYQVADSSHLLLFLCSHMFLLVGHEREGLAGGEGR